MCWVSVCLFVCVRPEFSWRSGLAPRCLDPANYASRWCSSRLIGVIPEPRPPGLLISVLLFLFFFLHFSSKCLSSSYPWGHPPTPGPRPQSHDHAPKQQVTPPSLFSLTAAYFQFWTHRLVAHRPSNHQPVAPEPVQPQPKIALAYTHTHTHTPRHACWFHHNQSRRLILVAFLPFLWRKDNFVQVGRAVGGGRVPIKTCFPRVLRVRSVAYFPHKNRLLPLFWLFMEARVS